MRLIDADKAHQELASCIADCCGQSGTYEEGLCDAMSVLDGQPTVGKDMNVPAGWVSVKDRLPEKQKPVLVYVPSYSDEDEEYIEHVAMSYYTYSANGGYWAGTDGNVYGAIGIIHEPSHWMPLPEPPKEDEKHEAD